MKQTECTTILVGKKATIDGSTMIARSEDGGRVIIPEGFKAVNPADQPKPVSYTHLTLPTILLV